MSNKIFAFDVEKLNKFAAGDIGIADLIHKLQIAPVLDKIKVPGDKAIFQKISQPDRMAGLHAIEKTVISSMLESQKPFIELIKICLELFGQMEYVRTVFLGGPNPENDPNSFLGAFNQNKAAMDKFDTGAKPAATPASGSTTGTSTTGVPTETTPPALPPEIFLGEYRRMSPGGDVFSTSSTVTGMFWLGKYWPQYTSLADYQTTQIASLEPQIIELDEESKKMVMDSRLENIAEEWAQLDANNQIAAGYKVETNGKINISKPFKTVDTYYNGLPVTIDIESDYNIVLRKFSSIGGQTFHITAKLGENATPAPPGSAKKKPEFFGPGSLKDIVKAFIKRVLPIITKKLMPAIAALKQLLSEPVKFIGDIMMVKLKEHFKMFDPSLKNLPEDDPVRKKYWSKNKFVMDGTAALDVGLLKITLGLKDGLPTFKIGAEPPAIPSTPSVPTTPGLPATPAAPTTPAVPNAPNTPAVPPVPPVPPVPTPAVPSAKEQPILKQVANLVALPINFLKGILDAFTELLNKIFKIKELPTVFADFTSLKWVKDLLSPTKLFEFLGAKDGDITTIPFLAIPKKGNMKVVPDMVKGFLQMIIDFINGFIGIPNTILNVELVPKIPLPDISALLASLVPVPPTPPPIPGIP